MTRRDIIGSCARLPIGTVFKSHFRVVIAVCGDRTIYSSHPRRRVNRDVRLPSRTISETSIENTLQLPPSDREVYL